jgi:hypothetical protein
MNHSPIQNLINELKQFAKFPMVDQPTIEAAIDFAQLRIEMEKEELYCEYSNLPSVKSYAS